MSTFEYLAVLFSVVVGLAVTQTLTGLLRLVHHRKTVRIYWPALIWTAAILQWTVFFWWFTGLDLATLGQWHFPNLLFVLAYGAVLYFLLGLLHPEEAGEGFDMRAHFEEQGRWFFGVFVGLGLLDLADTAFKGLAGTLTLPPEFWVPYALFLAVWLAGGLLLLRVRSPRVVGGVGVVYLVFTTYMTLQAPPMSSRVLGG